jgi:hypothetical protein
MLERPDLPVALPKLYVTTVNELFCIFAGGRIISTKKLYGPDEVSIAADDVGSVICHRSV